MLLCFWGVLSKELPASSIEQGSPSRYIRRTECGFSCPIRRTLLEAGRRISCLQVLQASFTRTIQNQFPNFSETCIIAIDKSWSLIKVCLFDQHIASAFVQLYLILCTRKGGSLQRSWTQKRVFRPFFIAACSCCMALTLFLIEKS